jgi:hypothetical protein
MFSHHPKGSQTNGTLAPVRVSCSHLFSLVVICLFFTANTVVQRHPDQEGISLTPPPFSIDSREEPAEVATEATEQHSAVARCHVELVLPPNEAFMRDGE